MATTINIHAAKTQLSRLIERAQRGEDIVIARAGRPAVRLVAIEPPDGPRVPGRFKGQLEIPDDAFAPLSEEELKEWYEAPIFPEVAPVRPSPGAAEGAAPSRKPAKRGRKR